MLEVTDTGTNGLYCDQRNIQYLSPGSPSGTIDFRENTIFPCSDMLGNIEKFPESECLVIIVSTHSDLIKHNSPLEFLFLTLSHLADFR